MLNLTEKTRGRAVTAAEVRESGLYCRWELVRGQVVEVKRARFATSPHYRVDVLQGGSFGSATFPYDATDEQMDAAIRKAHDEAQRAEDYINQGEADEERRTGWGVK